jgi:electron transfer flavoprotein beta subunit
VRLPALLTIQTGINEPRYANLRAIKQAKEKPLELLEPAELGVDGGALEAAAGSRTRSVAPPDTGGGAEMLSGSPSDVAHRIADIVKERMTG